MSLIENKMPQENPQDLLNPPIMDEGIEQVPTDSQILATAGIAAPPEMETNTFDSLVQQMMPEEDTQNENQNPAFRESLIQDAMATDEYKQERLEQEQRFAKDVQEGQQIIPESQKYVQDLTENTAKAFTDVANEESGFMDNFKKYFPGGWLAGEKRKDEIVNLARSVAAGVAILPQKMLNFIAFAVDLVKEGSGDSMRESGALYRAIIDENVGPKEKAFANEAIREIVPFVLGSIGLAKAIPGLYTLKGKSAAEIGAYLAKFGISEGALGFVLSDRDMDTVHGHHENK